MKVLVTGAAGFIGRHVSAKLVEAGHEVLGMDVALQPVKGYWHMWYIADITKPLDPIPDLDAVVHLAAVAAPRECDANPTRAFDVNVNGTLQVLNMALKSGAKKVVFSSSAHVYDIPPRYFPTDETHPLRLNNTYTTTNSWGSSSVSCSGRTMGWRSRHFGCSTPMGRGRERAISFPIRLRKRRSGVGRSKAATSRKTGYLSTTWRMPL